MSGPGKSGDGYRCDVCRRRKNRCVDCRAARAAAAAERRERKRAAGICVGCTAKAEPGYSRCLVCMEDNNERSGRAHAAARQERHQ